MLKLSRRYQFMIGVLAMTAFAPTLRMGFLWDDHVMIESNRTLQTWSWQNVKHDFTTDVFDHHGDAYYRPLQTLMNRLDFTWWGLQPFGYHLTNFIFHLGNALLFAELALVLGALPLTAFLAGSLFAVHPIIVEELMIIAGRGELMGLFFSLVSILMMLRGTRKACIAGGAAFIAALLSKESAVITPLLLLLVIYTRQEKPPNHQRAYWMMLALFPYLWLRHQMVGPLTVHANPWLTCRFFFQEFPHVIGKYVSLLLIPWNLHSHRLLPHLSHAWLLYLLLFIGFCFFLIRSYHRSAIFCIGWFILMLLPKTPVMIYGNFMLDHWAYPASFSLFLPLAWMVTRGWNSRKEWLRSLSGLLYFLALISWSLLVHLNVALRGTDEKMYRWALHFTTSNPIKYNLGLLLLQSGRPEEAAHYLEDVCFTYPEDPTSVCLLSQAYWASGHPQTALRLLQNYVKRYPPSPMTQNLLQRMTLQLKKK